MLRTAFRTLGSAALIVAFVNIAPGQESASVLDYLAQRADNLTRTWPPLPNTADAWEAYRSEVTGRLTDLLGLPDREPMKAAVTDTTEQGDLILEQVTYLWAGRTYVSATVIRSKQTNGRRPAVVMPSGFLGHYTFVPHRQFVDAMAGQGLVVLFVDDPRTGRRQAPYAGLYATASAAGIPVAGVQVFDALRGFDYLLTRADVDPGKIGIAGLEEGGLQACMAAALEPRFQFVVAAAGTATYQALTHAAAEHAGAKDPSTFVPGLLDFADMDRIAACIAPRPIFVAGHFETADGQAQVLQTMKTIYQLLGAEDRVQEVRGELSSDPRHAVDEVSKWLEERVLPSLHSPSAAPLACGAPEDPDFSMLHHMQRQVDELAKALPLPSPSLTAWQDHRRQLIAWLTTSCALSTMQPGADKVVAVSETGGVVTEQLLLGVDRDFRCPAVLVRPAETGTTKHTAIVLSHDDRQSAASAKIADAARRLAATGLWVLVPDHASVEPHSLQPLGNVSRPRFRGDDAANFYGPADAVSLPPLALRVVDDLAAVRHLAARTEVSPTGILLAGHGTGGVDACLAAVLDERIAGVISIDATTFRGWARDAASEQLHFFHIMPYLPSLLTTTDLDCVYAAMAPRPLIVIRPKDSWSRTGFDQVVATAATIYKLQQAESAFRALSWRDVTEEFITGLPDGIPKQLIAAAQPLLPTPPQPGTIGSVDGLKSRSAVDSATGLIWVVAEMTGCEQEFTGGPQALQSWSFFNDNGDAEKGRTITPLILKKEDSLYELVAIGTPRVNTGSGAQSFAFEPVEGSASVGPGYFFGWHTGDLQGHYNPGVVEFDAAADAQMIILTADGAMGDQQLKLGANYREHSRYRRHYSVTATSQKP